MAFEKHAKWLLDISNTIKNKIVVYEIFSDKSINPATECRCQD